MSGLVLNADVSSPVRISRRAAGAILLYNGLLLLWLLLRPAPERTIAAVDDVAEFLGPLLMLVAPLCALAWKRRSPRAALHLTWGARRSWSPFLLSLGAACFVLGQVIWTYYEQVLHRPSPLPSWADAGYLSIYPCLLLSILLLPGQPLPAAERARLALDGLMAFTTVLTCSWYFILAPILAGGSGGVVARIVNAAYPACDLLLFICVLALWARFGSSTLRPVMGLLLLALGIIMVADSIFDYQLLHNAYRTGTAIDVIWPLSYMTIALAASTLRQALAAATQSSTNHAATAPATSHAPERSADGSLWRALLPYFFVPLVGAVALATRTTPHDAGRDAGVYIGAAVLAGLLLLRQIFTILENRRLYARLDDAYTLQGEGLARRITELEWLRDVSRQVNTARTLAEVLDVTYEGVRALGFDRVGINLFNYEEGVFEDWIGTDATGGKIWAQNRTLQLTPESAIWRLPGVATALRGEDLHFTEHAYAECPEELRYLYDGEPEHNLMVTLRAGDLVVGNISVDNLVSGRPIALADAGPLLALANQVGTAVERARALAALEHQALYDPLTSLPNRALLLSRLGQALRAAQRGDACHALLLIDLNRFKEVNDTLGHHAGDALLQQVGTRLHDAVRLEDTVARLGGDEFAVLLPSTDAPGAAAVADKLLATLDAPFLVDGQQLDVGASIGISLSPEHGQEQTTLLRRADVAMYVAKRAGGGYAVYDAAHDGHSRERLALLGDLRHALAQGQLALYYQPLIDARSDSIYGVEALLRWQHPEHGFIPPDRFIPLAEQSGLIVPLTYWVLEQALCQCAEWRRRGLSLGVSVNLSMRSLHDQRLPDTLVGLLHRHGVPPALLTLEITESGLMADPAQVLAVLTRLHALGVRCSVDDFGTGYSSLAYLRQLPVDEIKIDRSFILDLGLDGKDNTLVRSIVAMAHELGLSVVAEGVETRQVYELLRAQGHLKVQGYYFSRALPPEQLAAWIGASSWGRCPASA